MVCVDRLAVVFWAAAVAAASAYPKVGDSRLVTMNDDDPLKCELYNSSCIAEASARGNSKEKCTGVEHCANRQAHYCIATWSPVAGNGTAPPNDGHRSGHQRPYSPELSHVLRRETNIKHGQECGQTKLFQFKFL